MSPQPPSVIDAQATGVGPHGVVQGLSRLDQFLPVWIGLAMVAGLLAGRWLPGVNDALDAVKVASVSLPIAMPRS